MRVAGIGRGGLATVQQEVYSAEGEALHLTLALLEGLDNEETRVEEAVDAVGLAVGAWVSGSTVKAVW